MEAVGYGGVVTFDGHFITIRHKGLGRFVVGKGEKRIPVASITSVQLKPAGPLVNGFIQFSLPGGVERRSSFGKQTADAVHDENSVVFTRKQQPQFEALLAEIEAAVVARSRPAPNQAPAAGGLADQLTQLSQLYTAGALSEREFLAAKARLLGT